MKKLLLLILCLFIFTGCTIFDTGSIKNKDVYTTIYPTKYLITYLYGDYATVNSIYPSGVDFKEYELSEKKLNEYAKSSLFVYNGLDIDRNYAIDMININPDIKLIDIALNMKQIDNVPESWLNPYNYLMMAKNTMTSLNEYITDPYTKQEIEEKYNTLEYELSKIDANYKETIESSKYKILVTNKDLFKYLEKYGLTVISLEEDIVTITITDSDTLDNISKNYDVSISDILTYNNKKEATITAGETLNIPVKTIDKSNLEYVKKLINNKQISYIYTDGSDINNTIKDLIDTYKLSTIEINTMYSIDGGITNTNDNYISIMNNNLELYQKELNK